MAQNKIQMPSSGAGLTRYFDDAKSKLEFKPGHVIVMVIMIIIIEIFLHWKGYGFLGLQ
jgi:preprotein translocase subunit Sec61beta